MTMRESDSNIISEIKTRGPITFAEYMDLALYYPREGYYMVEGDRIGAAGDFYTSSDVSDLFGKALADQFEEMWRIAGSPGRWNLLEQGAGKGVLARDIIRHIKIKYPDFFSALRYLIVEKSPAMRRRQEITLGEEVSPGQGIGWLGGIKEFGPAQVEGCIFSNELLDAFPVHRVVMEGETLKEIWVAWKGDSPVEFAGSLSSPELSRYIDDFNISLEDGQQAEINLAMKYWVENVAAYLSKGFVLTIDYGDTTEGLYTPDRFYGTIRSFRNHSLEEDLYKSPGNQDITASINFSALIRWGEEAGLSCAGYTTQSRFLMNMGIMEYIVKPDPASGFNPAYAKSLAAVKQLVMPEGMGSVFKVAAQCKGLSFDKELTGFKRNMGRRR